MFVPVSMGFGGRLEEALLGEESLGPPNSRVEKPRHAVSQNTPCHSTCEVRQDILRGPARVELNTCKICTCAGTGYVSTRQSPYVRARSVKRVTVCERKPSLQRCCRRTLMQLSRQNLQLQSPPDPLRKHCRTPDPIKGGTTSTAASQLRAAGLPLGGGRGQAAFSTAAFIQVCKPLV